MRILGYLSKCGGLNEHGTLCLIIWPRVGGKGRLKRHDLVGGGMSFELLEL